MKRSELKVGDELYYAKPRDWDHDHAGNKAVVLAVEPHMARDMHIRRGERFVEIDKGNGVLVEIHESRFSPRRDVVSLAHLRGPYAAVAAEVKIRAEQRRDRVATIQAQQKAVKAAADAVAQRARDAGFEPYGVLPDGALIALKPSVLAALLDAAGAPQADANIANARRVAEGGA